MALSLAAVASQPVGAWRVHDGRVVVRVAGREEPVVCACGRGHLLPTEHSGEGRLHLVCHGCGRQAWVPLAGRQGFSAPPR